MKKIRNWILGLLLILALGAGIIYFLAQNGMITPPSRDSSATEFTRVARTQEGEESITVAIQPASSVLSAVSAAGNIELVEQVQVALDVAGKVASIAASVGDEVKAGDPLLALETVEMDRAIMRAELDVETKRNALDRLIADASDADIAVARADLATAQDDLVTAQSGASDEEIAAARSNLASMSAKYSELQAGASDAELTQLGADLRSKEVALAEAQRAFDQVKWRGDSGMTSQAADLQQATIDYESAQAAYQESTAPADTSEVQSALSNIQDAQANLDELMTATTPAKIAAAEANVASTQAKLDDLLLGADETEVRDAEIALELALVDLQEAHANLAATQIVAPIDGVVLTIEAEAGERINSGVTVATIADTQQLKLTIDVAEVDIVQVAVGQAAEVEIDALVGQSFTGVVDYISPASDPSESVVSYAVTIRLVDEILVGVLPGMTAVATIAESSTVSENDWLVPTSAIEQQERGAFVMVVVEEEDGEEGNRPVRVEPGSEQGEWTVVNSAELQAGDQVVGDITSQINDDDGFGPGRRGPGRGPGGGGGQRGGG